MLIYKMWIGTDDVEMFPTTFSVSVYTACAVNSAFFAVRSLCHSVI